MSRTAKRAIATSAAMPSVIFCEDDSRIARVIARSPKGTCAQVAAKNKAQAGDAYDAGISMPRTGFFGVGSASYEVRMATAIGEAWAAKAEVNALLGARPWLRGLGIGGGASDGYFVRMNVVEESDDIQRAVPHQVRGVHVVLTDVGNLRAL